jgi:hypothetical protein
MEVWIVLLLLEACLLQGVLLPLLHIWAEIAAEFSGIGTWNSGQLQG